MATLILTAVGTAVGGPIGGAVGAILGQGADQSIFAPKSRHGPRLGELAVQTSSYGAAIPKIFGRMRIAGNVIWATDLREQRSSSGGAKGRPKSIAYSYSANFAVALSARRVLQIHRIWADGKLLRGAAGDFKTATDFRFHAGDEDQSPDPLIAASEGLALAPAFRGIAYAVFEDFQLEEYGNRIPTLTFEIEADAGEVAIGTIASELTDEEISPGETGLVAGFAASGDSVRSAILALADVLPLSLVDSDDGLLLTGAAGDVHQVADSDRVSAAIVTHKASGAIAAEVSIAYYDPARDYQMGLQRARRGGPTPKSNNYALPAALSAEAAKGIADRRLAALWAERSSLSIELGWDWLDARPGSTVTLPGTGGRWRVARWTLGPMKVGLELVRRPAVLASAIGAAPGRPVSQPDLIHGPTVLRILDLPPVGDAGGPALSVFAAGSQPGWRRAALLASLDGGATWEEAGPTAAPAVLGFSTSALPAALSALFDDRSTVEVELLHGEMWLETRDDQALAGGANLAMLGSELIQFGRAENIAPRRFRLKRLLRGRGGTEWAASTHLPGEDFTLISAESRLALALPPHAAGTVAQIVASGIGDEEAGTQASVAFAGESQRPPSPVHLGARMAGGDILIGWVRRSRLGWSWPSGADTPLGEERERYRLTIAGGSAERAVEIEQPSYLYTAEQQVADGAAAPMLISVTQLGTHGPSRPTAIVFGL